MADHVSWFQALGSCFQCGKPATGTLRGPRNESYGNACQKCAERRIAKAEKEREREALRGRSESTICVRCRNGEKPCVRGNPNQCEWMHAESVVEP